MELYAIISTDIELHFTTNKLTSKNPVQNVSTSSTQFSYLEHIKYVELELDYRQPVLQQQFHKLLQNNYLALNYNVWN